MIIGILGKAGVGKDTTADLIIKHLKINYPNLHVGKYSFADPLKQLCSYVFDIPMDWMYDQDLKKRDVYIEFNEYTDKAMEHWVRDNFNGKWEWHLARPELNTHFNQSSRQQNVARTLLDIFKKHIERDNKGVSRYTTTTRKILQIMGTEVFRNCVSEDFWCEIKGDAKNQTVTIIPDTRFESECDFIESNENSQLILVTDPNHEYDPSVGVHDSEKLVNEIEHDISNGVDQSNIYIMNNNREKGIDNLDETVKLFVENTLKPVIEREYS